MGRGGGAEGVAQLLSPDPVPSGLLAQTADQAQDARCGAAHCRQPHRLGGVVTQNALQDREGLASGRPQAPACGAGGEPGED